MTEKTDIAALKRPVRERHDWSKAIWRDCDHCGKEHTGTVTAKDGSSICAHCVDEKYWSAWQTLAETTLVQLEAERQRADELEAVALAIRDDMRVAREELAALRGDQEPFGYAFDDRAGNLQITRYKPTLAHDHKVEIVELFTRQPKPVVVHTDTVRMDWLCAHVVEVRKPMFYGSHAMFFGQCDSADDEEYHSKLREQIDAEIEASGIVVKDGE